MTKYKRPLLDRESWTPISRIPKYYILSATVRFEGKQLTDNDVIIAFVYIRNRDIHGTFCEIETVCKRMVWVNQTTSHILKVA